MGAITSAVNTIGQQIITFSDFIARFALAKEYFGDNNNSLIFAVLSSLTTESLSNCLVCSTKFRKFFIDVDKQTKVSLHDVNKLYQYFIIDPIIKIQWRSKISQIIKEYPITDQGHNKICWSHAIATAIYLSQSRIVGRRVLPFNTIVQSLLNEFGYNGQNIEYVMNKVLPKYKLHFNRASPNDLKDIILKSRICIARFSLNGIQWFNFSKFFNDPTKKNNAISANDINRKPKASELRGVELEDGGHAVILIDVNDEEYTFMNSWGEQWGDHGIFRIKKDAIDITFYDIFWYEKDLTQHEIQIWKDRSVEAIQTFYQICVDIDSLISMYYNCFYTQPILFLFNNSAKLISNSVYSSYPYYKESKNVLETIGFNINDETNEKNENYQVMIKEDCGVVVNGFFIDPDAINKMVIFITISCTIYNVNEQLKEMANKFWRIE
ncbi:hypothetical protein M9Y10_014557 [Tritrichomonas musculus]|uniref:Peptidase C1A papain C-terminal domain-containing protein n=1 Tax=Tritrichomonas musculus TaxID=1915356 RepID=A0ABR2L328_9EUKA